MNVSARGSVTVAHGLFLRQLPARYHCSSPASPRHRSPSWSCRSRCAAGRRLRWCPEHQGTRRAEPGPFIQRDGSLGRAQYHTSEAVLICVVKRCTDEPTADAPIPVCRAHEYVAEVSQRLSARPGRGIRS